MLHTARIADEQPNFSNRLPIENKKTTSLEVI